MNSLRGRARAELFASLFEALSGWNGTDGSAFSGAHIGKSFQPLKFVILIEYKHFRSWLFNLNNLSFFSKKRK